MNHYIYPFSAFVGQEALKTALLLNAVDPNLGGVLIRGEKGTGKSTAARGLAEIMPVITVVADCVFHCPPDDPNSMHDACLAMYRKGEKLSEESIPTPFIELPLNATEDRVAGTLHIEETLRSGQRRFEPGLLAAANRGLLYVDEVNLVEDHIVDLLLDAAASGINIVEREGISYVHPARFTLIGSMNPEEGELRPQFLDRFALCVAVETIKDRNLRREIVRRRVAFEKDPDNFFNQWSESDQFLKSQVRRGRANLNNVQINQELVDLAVRLATDADVQGHRAEIIMIKAARALASLMDKKKAEVEDILEATYFVLPHRVPGYAFVPKSQLSEKLEKTMKAISDQKGGPSDEGLDIERAIFDEDDHDAESIQVPGAAASGSILFDFIKKKEMKL